MKNLKVLTFLLALVPTVTACQDIEHSVVAINNMGSSYTLVDVSTEQVLALLESKQSFVLETYSNGCIHCQSLRPKLEKYSKGQKKTIYTLNAEVFDGMEEEEYNNSFHNPHSDIFPTLNSFYVPKIQFIKEGKLTYQVSSSKFSSYNPLKNIMNNHFISSKIVLVETEDDLKAFEEKYKSYVAFSYDLENVKSLTLANTYIINNEIAKAKKPVVLINYTTYTGVFNDVCAKYNSEVTSFASLIKNGEVNKTIDYSSADGNELNNLLSSL